jgi:RecG-like helicase
MCSLSSNGSPESPSSDASGAKRAGVFKRTLHKLTASADELESEDLRTQSDKTGATAVAQCGERDTVCIAGTVRSTQVDMRGGSPMLNVDLYDGTGSVTVVFLGRRKVAGIEPGRSVKVTGRLTTTDGRRTMYNPSYELLASSPA